MKMILDLDTGIDDALALAYAAGHPQVELLGVTNVFGNVTVEEAVRNTLDILKLLKKQVPVYRGSSCALHKTSYEPPAISRKIHGQNGIGEIEILPSGGCCEEQCAVDFLIESIHKYGKDLTIVATSPLTNIARALEKDPGIVKELGSLVVMGGAVTVPGNVTPFAEANIIGDPEAAKYVLESDFHITMVGLDVTLRTLLTEEETSVMKQWGSEGAVKLAEMIEYYFGAYQDRNGWMKGCPLHDPLAVGIAVDRTLAMTHPLHLSVETEGPAKGRTIGNRQKLTDNNPNVHICINVDAERFLADFMHTLKGLMGSEGEINGK